MSLIEVVLAMGVVAFAIIPLVGLFGVGLTTVGAAHEETARVNILNFMQSNLRARSYSSTAWTPASNTASAILLNASTSRPQYFDAQGSWVCEGTSIGTNAAGDL